MTAAAIPATTPLKRSAEENEPFQIPRAQRAEKLRATVLEPARLDADLIERWKQFCRADPLYQSPFYWPQFTMAAAQSRGDARVAVFENSGEVIGFLPFHLTRGAVGKPIGGHINDYHGPILAPGTVLTGKAMLSASRLAAYDYNHLPATFAALGNTSGPPAFSPQMDLASGYEAYVARRDSRWSKAQREIRRRQRKTEAEHGPIRFALHDPSDHLFEQLIEMKNKQYERMGIRMRMGAGWAGETIRLLHSIQENEFSAVTSTLHAGDRLIAAHFGLRTANLLHWWFPTYDLGLSRLGPGINLVNHCAIAASAAGIATIDFGRGDEDFKQHFADRQIALCEGSIVVPGSAASRFRHGSQVFTSLADRIPLGRFQTFPRKAVARLISGVGLPS